MKTNEQLRATSKRNAWLTIIGAMIVMSSLLYSSYELSVLEDRVLEKKNELDQLDKLIAKAKEEISRQNEEINQLEQVAKPEDLETLAGGYPDKETEGWVYIGTFNEEWNSINFNILNTLPEQGSEYIAIVNVSLRYSFPKFPLYSMGERTGFVEKGQKVVIKDVKTVGFGRVWALVDVKDM